MLQSDVGTCDWLVDELVAARLAERERLEPHLAEFTAESPYADADAFAKHLAREGIITKYQARRAIDGDSKKLLLGAYLLTDVIGSGSLGPVYRARGRADQHPYAVKVLPQRAWNVRLARSQVKAFGELPAHDGIVPFIDVGTAHGLHYLVWPFAEGRSLENLIREHGPLSPGEVARIGVRIAEALKVALTRGLIHGLVKPSNVLVSADGQAKLLDFGIGALLAENPDDDVLVDTVSRAESLAHIIECAAPESIADSSQWHPAGDQYSLGCTLYFCLTGRVPFPEGSAVEKMMAHQAKEPMEIRELAPDVPEGLCEIVKKLMAKVPEERYSGCDEVVESLEPFLGDLRAIPGGVPSTGSGRVSMAGLNRGTGHSSSRMPGLGTRGAGSHNGTRLPAPSSNPGTRLPPPGSHPGVRTAPAASHPGVKINPMPTMHPGVKMNPAPLPGPKTQTPAPTRGPSLPSRASLQHGYQPEEYDSGAMAVAAMPGVETANPTRVPSRAEQASWGDQEQALARPAAFGPVGMIAAAMFIMVAVYLGTTLLMTK